MGETVKVTTNFSKGLSFAASHRIDPEECQVAENFMFDDGGAYVRAGSLVYGSLPAPVVVLQKVYLRNGSSYFTAFAATGSGPRLYSSCMSGQYTSVSHAKMLSGDVDIAIYDNYLYFGNLSGDPKLFTGSAVEEVGLSSPIFRKQIFDFGNTALSSAWGLSGWVTEGSGVVSSETRIGRVDLGSMANIFTGTSCTFYTQLRHGTSGLCLSDFYTSSGGCPSDLDDFLQIYAVADNKNSFSNVSSYTGGLGLQFYLVAADHVINKISMTSSWVGTSGDGIATTFTIPKRDFLIYGLQSAPLNSSSWQGCNEVAIQFMCSSGAVGGSSPMPIVSLDNLRMVKSPPIVTAVSMASWSGQFTAMGYYQIQNENARKYLTEIGITPVSKENPDMYSIADQAARGRMEQILASEFGGISYVGAVYVPATSSPIGVSNTSGQYPSIVYYKVTFIKSGSLGKEIESNPSLATSGCVLSCNASSWVGTHLDRLTIAPAHMNVDGRRIYRRLNTDTAYRAVATVWNNTQTTFNDFVPTDYLGQALEVDHWPPPNSKFIHCAPNQKTYYFNLCEDGARTPCRVRWSKPYEPHYVPLENIREISPNDGTEGTGIFDFSNMVYLLKERSTWALDENDTLRSVHDSIGCVAPKSIARGDNEVFWLSELGIVRYNLRFDNISKDRLRVDKVIKRLPKEFIGNAAGIYYQGKYLLSVTDEGATTNNLVLCYDTYSDTWSTFPNLNVNCWTTWQGYKDGYRLFYGNNSGLVCEFFAGEYDVSSPIYSRIRCKDFGGESPQVFMRKSYLYTESLDGKNREIQVKPYYDYSNLSSENTVATLSGLSTNDHLVSKVVFPQRDDASYLSLELITSGRYRIHALELYGRKENLR